MNRSLGFKQCGLYFLHWGHPDFKGDSRIWERKGLGTTVLNSHVSQILNRQTCRVCGTGKFA